MSYTATIVTDLGFGDAGKGTIIDTLTRRSSAPVIVRYNGGGQAAHNVVTPDGVHHTFSQFGSGSFVRGARTHLSRFMLVDPHRLEEEALELSDRVCRDVFSRLTVDERARIVSPYQKAANRIREEARGKNRHGSCGMGIGETMQDQIEHPELAIYAHDLGNYPLLLWKLTQIQELKRAALSGAGTHGPLHELLEDAGSPRVVAELYARIGSRMKIVAPEYLGTLALSGDLLFEGAQGVLLDEWHGFHPYTTWSTTTSENAFTLLREIGHEESATVLGVLRAYHTRHGAGPFVTEDERLTALIPDTHNGTHPWQGPFRVGWFDFVMARYAIAVNGGVDALAVTNVDRFSAVRDRRVCESYLVSAGDGGATSLTRLPVKTERTDLVFQEKLTRLLETAVPEYTKVSDDNETYLERIEEELRVPITIASYGPAATDKRFRA